MSRLGRLVLTAVWALSLVAAAAWGARAQGSSQATPGSEVRFVRTGTTHAGMPTGVLSALQDGQWVTVSVPTDVTVRAMPLLEGKP